MSFEIALAQAGLSSGETTIYSHTIFEGKADPTICTSGGCVCASLGPDTVQRQGSRQGRLQVTGCIPTRTVSTPSRCNIQNFGLSDFCGGWR